MFPKLKRIKKAAGMPFFFSLTGTSATKAELAFLSETMPSGIIFFKRNIENCDSLRSLIDTLKRTESPKYFAIDEEGGRVRRLPQGDYSLPSAKEMAEMDESVMFDKVRILGAKLREIGINMDMAPVVDLRSGEDSTIIGDRSFSHDPEAVIRKADIYLKALAKEGINGVIKHYPGHGTTITDSHKSLPKINKNIKELYDEDILPYRKLKSDFVMIAHLLHEEISPLPSSLSPEWNDILRKTGFAGITMTDDIEMKALDIYSAEEKTGLFIRSGYDMMLVCSGNPEVLTSHWEAMVKAVERDDILLERLENLENRMEKIIVNLNRQLI